MDNLKYNADKDSYYFEGGPEFSGEFLRHIPKMDQYAQMKIQLIEKMAIALEAMESHWFDASNPDVGACYFCDANMREGYYGKHEEDCAIDLNHKGLVAYREFIRKNEQTNNRNFIFYFCIPSLWFYGFYPRKRNQSHSNFKMKTIEITKIKEEWYCACCGKASSTKPSFIWIGNLLHNLADIWADLGVRIIKYLEKKSK